jgi:hypothetical protein
VWADHDALGGAIAEIDTMAVLTRHDRPIDNPDVETGASTRAMMVAATPRRRRLNLAPDALPARASIVRAYNVFGEISETPGDRAFTGSVDQWTQTLTSLVVDTGMDTFLFAAPNDDLSQTQRFAGEVGPAVRDVVGERRRT